MKERSNTQLPWHGICQIEKDGTRWVIRDLLVRWGETTEQRETEEGTETEYIYTSHRIDVDLPPEVQPGIEAVELYLEAAKAAILQLAQDLGAQEAGFA